MKNYTQQELDDMSGWYIACLLRDQPHYFGKVDKNKMGGCDIAYLLQEQPQFFDKVDINKMDGWDISCLLQVQPHLFNELAVEKMDGLAVSCLLQEQPQFFDKVDINKMDGWAISCLLQKQLKLKKHFPNFKQQNKMKNTKKSATVTPVRRGRPPKVKIYESHPETFLQKLCTYLYPALIILTLGLIGIGLFMKYAPEANAFFWRNPQQVYDDSVEQEQIATQNFIQARLSKINAQVDLAYHKIENASKTQNNEEIGRLNKVIDNLKKEIELVKQHTKIVFLQALK